MKARRLALLACVAVTVAAAGAQTEPRDHAPDRAARPDPVSLFLSRRDDPVRSYRARRRLEAHNARFDRHGWLEAMTSLGPQGFTFEVLSEGGSDLIRRRVLYAALEGEREIVATPTSDAALSAANYEMVADGADGGWARIRIVPRRKDRLLVDGWLLVSPHDGDLGAIGGRLSKSPSFWTTRVDVQRRYARVGGVRVPVSVESTASVRIAGTSTFAMRYDYEVVNGVDIPR